MGSLADLKDRERSQLSTGWKDVTMKIFGTDEKITIPVMISSKVQDVKNLIAEMHGDVAPHQLEFVFKQGPSYKRHRNGDEIQSNILVKGIKSFVKGDWQWPHPYMVIGAGHMGLRQALHYTRKGLPYLLFDRFQRCGGNAWVGIGNVTSKLQTEGPQYQLQYDIFDKNIHGLMQVAKYGYWPSREEILAHFEEVCNEYGVTPQIRMATSVEEMTVHESRDSDIRNKFYEFSWKTTKEGKSEEGIFKASCLCYYPGCLVVPHRKTWPGEDVFAGQIGYGFSHEFDYTKLPGQDAIIIGMGAFAHENVRTFVEHGGRKAYNIARHFNLMMPRLVCWWINQSVCPPTAAMVLQAMMPMYALVGLNPWNFFSVTANAERTVATIKQYTRWGISDIYILSMYFDKCETITGEVKRFKENSIILNTGRVLEDIDHIIKVIGFDGDFGVDRLMRTKVNIGPWPDGDWRRFTLSDQSAIDASRFTNIAISPAVSSMSFLTLYYHQHPDCAGMAMSSGMMPENRSEPEIGSPAYHYEPRKGTAMMMVVGGVAPDLGRFDEWNGKMKKCSMHHIAHADAYQAACERDWYKYCKLFRDQGAMAKWPVYPYSKKEAHRLVGLEDELARQEQLKWMQRMGISQEQMDAAQQQQAPPPPMGDENMLQGEEIQAAQEPQYEQWQVEQWERQERERREREEADHILPQCMPGDHQSFDPARIVLHQRQRSKSPARDDAERRQWLKQGHDHKDFLVRAMRRSVSPKALKR